MDQKSCATPDLFARPLVKLELRDLIDAIILCNLIILLPHWRGGGGERSSSMNTCDVEFYFEY